MQTLPQFPNRATCDPTMADAQPTIEHETFPTVQRTVGTTADRLRSFVTRIETLEAEKDGIGADIKEVYGEAKGEGFDVKVLRKVIALRKIAEAERAEEEELLALYMSAIGEAA